MGIDPKALPLRIKIALLEDIPPGTARIVSGPDHKEIALFNIEGEIIALNNDCPHDGGPLGEGQISGCKVTCPWHGWEFDLRSGACTNVEGEFAEKFEIEISEGIIYLRRESSNSL